MTAKQLETARTVLTLSDFTVGDRVRVRRWTVPPAGTCQPMVERRVRVITSIDRGLIYCGRFEFDAFELVKA